MAVMLSIHPEWASLIVSGRKTLEVRKTMPKLKPPFKCYIYATKKINWLDVDGTHLDGNVVGEFVCNKIIPFDVPYPAFQSQMDKDILGRSCNTYYQLHRYAYHNCLYAWQISKLRKYDRPIPLSEFQRPDQTPLIKAPQSWCYVKEVE